MSGGYTSITGSFHHNSLSYSPGRIGTKRQGVDPTQCPPPLSTYLAQPNFSSHRRDGSIMEIV